MTAKPRDPLASTEDYHPSMMEALRSAKGLDPKGDGDRELKPSAEKDGKP